MLKKILVIGSGKRVKEGIIPALFCLQNEFEIEAVYSRSIKTISLFNDTWKKKTIDDLRGVDFKKLSYIFIAVTLSEVPKVLKKLSDFDTSHITVFLDTPVLPHTKLGASKYFKNFKNVLVPEDSIALPSFKLAKKLIGEGKIGKLKRIYIFHEGYRYHALAALKFLTSSNVKKITNKVWSKKADCIEWDFHFKNVRATMLDPRDYNAGRFLIVGEKGMIADYNLTGANTYRIEYIVENGNYRGLKLNGQKVEADNLDKLFLKNVSDDLYKKSVMNSMKIRGIMEILNGVDKGDKKYFYSAKTGIYDILAIMISEKFGYFRDFSFGKISSFALLAKMLSKVLPK